MQLNITFRHFDSTDSLKNYAQEKVERVNKYLDRAGEAHVVLSLERHLHHADITIHSGNFVLRGREKSEDMYASIDLAMDKIERQLRKYKEKLKNHHGRERVHHRQELVSNLKVRHDVFELPGEFLEESAEESCPQAAGRRARAARLADRAHQRVHRQADDGGRGGDADGPDEQRLLRVPARHHARGVRGVPAQGRRAVRPHRRARARPNARLKPV